MNINYVIAYIHSFLFFQIYAVDGLKDLRCVKNLVNYIKQDARKYQVMIILNNRGLSSESAEDIVYQISSKIPNLIIDLNDLSIVEKFVLLPVFDEPRITDFIVIDDSLRINAKKLDLTKVLDFLNKLTPRRIRPKCLIISLTAAENSYENILQRMWSKKFVDVTILQLAENKASKNLFEHHDQMKARIHQLNPFTNIYQKLKCSRKIEWFPDKLRDMKGFTLNASLTNFVPHSIVKFNASGHVVEYSGADILTFKTLSDKMKFSTSFITEIGKDEGVYNFKNKSATGMFEMLAQHKINAIITTFVKFIPPKQSLTEYTRMIESESLHALVPILPGPDVVLHQNRLYTSVLTILMVLVLIYMTSRLLRFAEVYWQPIDIFRLLLGMGTLQEPTTVPERIFFTSAIVLAFCYGSELFAGITSINLNVGTEMEFNTFEDLDNSNLTLILHPNFFAATFEDAEGALINLKKKCLKMLRCPAESLVKNRNISCLHRTSLAKATIDSHRGEFERPTIKTIKQPFWVSGSAMQLEFRSPYVQRFDEILIRISEAGLRKKWSGKYSHDLDYFFDKNREISDFENVGGVTNLRRRFVFVALHGYSLGIVAFLGEILFYYCSRLFSVILVRVRNLYSNLRRYTWV